MNGKDFLSDQEVRWCPGCGDYSVLKQFTEVLASLEADPANTVVVSGIGCSSRLPYYVNTYGIHSLHGRAPSVATGIKLANPSLDVWIITGDGDALSIGGNHLLHVLRRNVQVPILLFNNEIYGLTKGQYSPTSRAGALSKSTPLGSIDYPLNPQTLALGAGATFVARSMDRNPTHLRQMLMLAKSHEGSALVEIYQNCNVFNDGVFEAFTDKKMQSDHAIFLTHGEPLVFGSHRDKGLVLSGSQVQVVSLTDRSASECWIHDERDPMKAYALARMTGDLRPFGVFYREDRSVFEKQVHRALSETRSLEEVLAMGRTWKVD
ncbi:MAG TPA: 2-oxoacid:ferredoxin oxidoreductase subunit beta [Cryomorphaceae bacterium]|jgi:2-oxoglutarate/2-oxoacid ferredoxin oxidoreductase subunit beta|nr:2-oxoacid:ferredoxin oxidoreductase subunit beta [Cryomorphaceae bacterium]HAG49553.1 2-oxoacid:ferredoxin oxidoreductase subunit beta [Cryomorphaceae bacterium]